jgi:hypothetical protein
MEDRPTLAVQYGCLVSKRERSELRAIAIEHSATRDFAVLETRLARPSRGCETAEIVCGLCGAHVPVIVRSRAFVVRKVLLSWVVFVIIPTLMAWALGRDYALLIGLPVAVAIVVLLSHAILYFIDYRLGHATAAVAWPKTRRESDFDNQLNDFKHEFLSVRQIASESDSPLPADAPAGASNGMMSEQLSLLEDAIPRLHRQDLRQDFEEASGNPSKCPACGAVITRKTTRCPSCGIVFC